MPSFAQPDLSAEKVRGGDVAAIRALPLRIEDRALVAGAVSLVQFAAL